MNKKIILTIVLIFCIGLGGCLIRVPSLPEQETEKKEDTISKQESKPEVTKAPTNINYVGGEIMTDDYYGKIVLFYFDFENVSEDNKTFAYTYTVKAFQNGVEMDRAYMVDNEYDDNSIKEIRPNTKIKVAESFVLNDDKSPIVLEVSPWISFNNEKLMEIEINIK